MRYKTKTKDCHLIVKAKASWGEKIDEIALGMFARIYLRGFLQPKIVKKNVIEYSGPVGISLYERLSKPLSKRDFLFIIEQIVVAVQKLQANSMGLNNLVMNPHHVYVNEVTKEIQFIYIPVIPGLQNFSLIDFIETIAYSAKPANDRDSDCISRFIYSFKSIKSMKPFDINNVESFVAKEDRSVVNIIKKQYVGQSGFMTSKQKHYYDHYNGRSGENDDEPTGLLNENEDEPTDLLYEDNDSTGLLEENDEEATGLLDKDDDIGYLDEDDEATGLLSPDDEGGTALLDESQSIHYPTLLRVLTDEVISINKPVFRLGKERSYVDYFVTNNNAVSRSHADIITRGNRFYVIDLNSKNHTYINEQIIAVQCETEICDGDRLKLGNEEFIFHI